MKTYLTYGFAIALAGALLNLGLYFAGYHSDPSKITAAQMIGSIGGGGIAILGIVLGIRARRAEAIAGGKDFSYGQAFGAGVMVAVFAGIFGMFTTYLYMNVINPGMGDLIMQSQADKLAAGGMSGEQIEQMQSITRKMMSPPLMAAMSFIGAVFAGTIISLIAAAFLKRNASDAPPLVA